MSYASVLDRASSILCYYINQTQNVQVVRFANVSTSTFERVVFVGQRLMFEAETAHQLAVYTWVGNEPTLHNIIPCSSLQVQEG